MTALTTGVAREAKDSKLVPYGVLADEIIFRGALVMIDAAGFLQPCSQIAGSVFAGVAREGVDATGLSSGECSGLVETRDAFYVNIAAAAVLNIGDDVFALDDNTVELTQTANSVPVGKILEIVSATKVLVLPDPNQVKA